jgi:hypothetical protein
LFSRRDVDDRRGRINDDCFILARFRRYWIVWFVGRRHIVRRIDRIVLARFVDLHRHAVEIRIGEVVGRLAEIEQGEVILPRALGEIDLLTNLR